MATRYFRSAANRKQPPHPPPPPHPSNTTTIPSTACQSYANDMQIASTRTTSRDDPRKGRAYWFKVGWFTGLRYANRRIPITVRLDSVGPRMTLERFLFFKVGTRTASYRILQGLVRLHWVRLDFYLVLLGLTRLDFKKKLPTHVLNVASDQRWAYLQTWSTGLQGWSKLSRFVWRANDAMASKVSAFDVRECRGGGVSSDGVEGGGFWMLFSELNECNSRRESPWWFLEPGDSCSGRPVPRPCDVGKCEAGNVQIRCSIFAWLMVENNLLVMGEAVLSFAHSASHDFWIEFH